ncbi:MAG: GntR family transcriptional regulator, partial [Paenibacillus sp.]|nr:GntR family transcriptional regulator [Paenibacillus sp.]
MSQVSSGKSLGEQAYETIRDSILTLQLAPGQTIYENELADSLQISRTPIRDAFHL